MVSVVIAAYNAGKFIGEAIESVLTQNDVDLELIVVDDGSTDNTSEIAESYGRDDERVLVISVSNGGLSKARNIGVSKSKGDHIVFLDADDLFASGAVALLKNVAESSGAAIVCSPIFKFRKLPACPDLERVSYSLRGGEELVEDILYQKGTIDNSMCGKLFCRRLLDRYQFREGTAYEDLDIFYKIFLDAGEIAIVESPGYLYRQHSGSFIHTFSMKRLDVLEVTSGMCEYMETLGKPSLISAAKSRRLSANFNILFLLLRNRKIIDRKLRLTIVNGCLSTIKGLSESCRGDKKMRLKNKIALKFCTLLKVVVQL